jgi:histone H3/H4
MGKDFVKGKAIKDFISKEKKLRSADAAVSILESRINELMVEILNISAEKATEADRKTVLEEDINFALDKAVAKKDLGWEEILDQIIKETPADLGKISSGINQYIENRQ